MIKEVKETIDKYNMINRGDKIVVGFSGGPDSSCLLDILYRLRDEYDISLYAVHFNHMIRGEEAFRDENFAREFAEKRGIPFFLKRMEVEKYARQERMSCEQAGRYLRYKFFNEVLAKTESNKIALAHNMNDQAETVILNFFRGSGITGLSGISPVRENLYIRPLIFCTRDKIENYCRENSLNPVIDSTNNENLYKRNIIRHNVIPYINDHFNQNIIESLSRTALISEDEDEFLNEEAEKNLNSIKTEKGYLIKEFNNFHKAMQRRIIRSVIKEVKGSLNIIELTHIDACVDLINKGSTGKEICLPGDIICKTEYDVFKIEHRKAIKKFCYDIPPCGELYVENLNLYVKTRIFEKNSQNFVDTPFIKYFDYDKINNVLKFRNRMDGDFIYPKGMNGKKKIKDFFIDKKIPKDIRDTIPFVAAGNEVLWILGYRDSKNYKVTNSTINIIEVKIERGA